jgi:hypothetical protein
LTTENRTPPVTTGSDGRFTLGITPGAISVLTARRPGFGPTRETIRVGTEPLRVNLALQPPQTLGGRAVDRTGRPIVGATLAVQSWRGSRSLEQEVTTRADGRFVLKDAPRDGVRVEVYANGYVRRMDVSVVPRAQNQIVMSAPTTVKGTVVDAQTGQPIRHFSLVHGTVCNAGQRLIWRQNGRAEREATEAAGTFTWAFIEQVHLFVVRVGAEG